MMVRQLVSFPLEFACMFLTCHPIGFVIQVGTEQTMVRRKKKIQFKESEKILIGCDCNCRGSSVFSPVRVDKFSKQMNVDPFKSGAHFICREKESVVFFFHFFIFSFFHFFIFSFFHFFHFFIFSFFHFLHFILHSSTSIVEPFLVGSVN